MYKASQCKQMQESAKMKMEMYLRQQAVAQDQRLLRQPEKINRKKNVAFEYK